jgi:hypothetical protein
MACLHSVCGWDGFQMWMIGASVFNKQARTACERWPSSVDVTRGSQTPYVKNLKYCGMLHKASESACEEKRDNISGDLAYIGGQNWNCSWVGFEYMGLVHAAEVRDRWRANFRVPWRKGRFFIRWATSNFSATLLRGGFEIFLLSFFW